MYVHACKNVLCVCVYMYAYKDVLVCVLISFLIHQFHFGLWYLLFNIKRSWIKSKAIGNNYVLLTWSSTKTTEACFVLETSSTRDLGSG